MSASLIVLIPLVLLGLVGTLCFVGCFLDSGPYPSLFGPYQTAIINEPSLVAYWPLNDQPPSPLAIDAVTSPGQFNGTYTAPVTLGKAGIVPGDVAPSGGTPNTCVFFNGGFVQIGFQSALNPAAPFSIEAWVKPEWTVTDPATVRVVVAGDDLNMFTGYQLHATAENHWAASVGAGSQFVIAKRPANDPPTILFGQANHLVATFDGATLIIFVNGVISAQAAMPAMSAFVPSVSPTPLSFGITSVGTPPPQSPFNGEIQDVAFYSAALDAATILNHFKIGIGG